MMKKSSKLHLLTDICIVYTILSLFKIIFEWITLNELNATGKNLLYLFIITSLSVWILSQYRRFMQFPPYLVMIIQYIIAMSTVFLIVWFSGRFEKLHPNAYRDIFISFTIPYVFLAICYYVGFYMEVKKQDELLQKIKKTEFEKRNHLRN